MTRDLEPRQLVDILGKRIGTRLLALFLGYDGVLVSGEARSSAAEFRLCDPEAASAFLEAVD